MIKYPRTQHLEGSRLQPGDQDLAQVGLGELRGRYVVVEEKLDGANTGLSLGDDGRVRLQSRGHFLVGGHRERHWDLLKQWAAVWSAQLEALLAGGLVLYGEWLYAKHTIAYDALPHYLLEFDVRSPDGAFWSTARRRALLADAPFVRSVPVLWEGVLRTPSELPALVGPSLYKTPRWREALRVAAEAAGVESARVADETDPSDDAEGLYVKVEEDGVVTERYKWVRASFLTAVLDSGGHWLDRPIVPNGLADGVELFVLMIDPSELAQDLAATPQDAQFHAEGDVWTHTQMVLAALVEQDSWKALDDAGRRITYAACLLHDVGKPATTRHEPDGRISSRGHSAKGEHLVRRWLWERGAPFGEREHVCALVRHHQVPFFGVTRPEAQAAHTATKLSLRLRHDWLAVVAEADARGRRCTDPADQQRMLDHTALWVVLCQELGCLDRPRAFDSDHARVVYCESEALRARPPDVAVHDDTTCEVVVMVGLPASGKDTWLASYQGPIVSLDALREELDVDPADGQGGVIAAAREAAREHLRAGRGFAWNATNLGDKLRAGVIALARGYRARVRVVYCEATCAQQEARNRARPSPVPRAAIDRMLDRWTMPALDEAHAVEYVGPAVSRPSWPADTPAARAADPSTR